MQKTDLEFYSSNNIDDYLASPNGMLQFYSHGDNTISTISRDLPSDPNDPTQFNKENSFNNPKYDKNEPEIPQIEVKHKYIEEF